MSEKEMAKELLNIRELYKDVRLCPKCRMAITKTEGCNKMVCGSCGQFFCFQCGMVITGYEHFRDAVNCKLFAASDIAEWERQMQALDIGRRMRISLRPIGGNVRCPKCRAINFKADGREQEKVKTPWVTGMHGPQVAFAPVRICMRAEWKKVYRMICSIELELFGLLPQLWRRFGLPILRNLTKSI